jgi:hypothetical protein
MNTEKNRMRHITVKNFVWTDQVVRLWRKRIPVREAFTSEVFFSVKMNFITLK